VSKHSSIYNQNTLECYWYNAGVHRYFAAAVYIDALIVVVSMDDTLVN